MPPGNSTVDGGGAYLERGAKLIAFALDMEKRGEFSLAIDSLARGIEILLQGGNEDNNEKRKKHVYTRLLDYLHKLEMLKKQLMAQMHQRLMKPKPEAKPKLLQLNDVGDDDDDEDPFVMDDAMWKEVDSVLGKKTVVPAQQPSQPPQKQPYRNQGVAIPHGTPSQSLSYSITPHPQTHPQRTLHQQQNLELTQERKKDVATEGKEVCEDDNTEEEMEEFQDKYLNLSVDHQDASNGKMLGGKKEGSEEKEEEGEGDDEKKEKEEMNALIAKSEAISRMANDILKDELKELKKQQLEAMRLQKEQKEKILDPLDDLVKQFNESMYK